VRRGSLIHRLASMAMGWGFRSCKLIACLDSDMLRHLHLQNDHRAFISCPWPPLHLALPDEPVSPPGNRIRWIYSGNLGRAHEFETLLRAQKVLEESGQPFDLVFQGGGNAWSAAKCLAAELGLQHCQWESYAPAEKLVSSLLQAHVLIATQRQEVKGLLWPSKLALLRLLPRPIVWVGPLDGAIAADLRSQGTQHGVFAAGDSQGLATWLVHQASDLAALSKASFSPATLKPICQNVARGEGEKWWSHLTQLFHPDAPDEVPLKVPLAGESA
jgi:colanic acid biosynthesis glycosyl transferase WcaI